MAVMGKDIQLPQDIVCCCAATHAEYGVIVRRLFQIGCGYAIECLLLLFGDGNINDRFFHAVWLPAEVGVKPVDRAFLEIAVPVGFLRKQMTFSTRRKIQYPAAISFNANMAAKNAAKPFSFRVLIFFRWPGAIEEVHLYVQAVLRMSQGTAEAKDDED